MNNFYAFLYGIIQGLTEFIPVSSSGHLALIPKFFPLEDPGLFFDILMHFGTALAVIIYFKKDVFRLIYGVIEILKNPTDRSKWDKFTFNFCLATLVSVVFILVLKSTALDSGRDSKLIGINLIIFGILLYLSDRKAENPTNEMESEQIKKSALIGAAQAFAIFPGVSRSGITLTASRWMGLGRKDASAFSFLLSLPIILAAMAKKSLDMASVGALDYDLMPLIIGVLTSFIVGLLTIHFFLKLIAKIPFYWFTLYRILLGALVLIYA